MIIRFIVAVFVLSVSPVFTALAEGPLPAPMSRRETECAESYAARLADAKTAIAEYDTYMAEYKKALPAVEWFALHCRFLTELEIAVRKLDDPNAFVCDPSARGKPKGMTAEVILNYSTEATPMTYQTKQGENHVCASSDAKGGRMVLTFFGTLTSVEILEILCYADERPSCVEARETIAKLRAKGKVPG